MRERGEGKPQSMYFCTSKNERLFMNLDLRPLALPAAPCGEKTLLIAGPCAAETEAQVMQTARELASFGVKIFRAGIWKPRTKPGGFEGKGLEALPWLRRVNGELGPIRA